MSHLRTNHVAIIGGGLSGLATAVHLHLADPTIEITLLEASPRIGGVIDTEREGDFLIDCGADMFATQPPAAINLLKKIGVEDQLILPQQQGRGARIVHRGRLIDLPDGFVLMRATKFWPMMTTPLLSLPGKLRFLRERWIGPPSASAADNDVSVAEFVRRRLGDEVLQNIVGPLVAGIYTADVEKLSMEATMGPMANMVRQHGSLAKATTARRRTGQDKVERGSSGARYERFRAFAGGMICLIDALAQSLPAGSIRTRAAVDAVRRSDSQWEVRVNGDPQCFDQVVVATPPAIAAGLLSEISAAATQDLAAIESASTAIVVLAVPRTQITADVSTFGFVVPPKENRRILAASFASNKFAGRAPADHVLIRVFIGGMLQSHLLQRSDSDLLQLAQEELADLIGLSGEPTLFRVVRWNHAMPQYHVGHRQRVARIENAIEELPGIWLVNNALHGVGIAPVIQAAENLAVQIAASQQR